jgi:hypothetical protein
MNPRVAVCMKKASSERWNKRLIADLRCGPYVLGMEQRRQVSSARAAFKSEINEEKIENLRRRAHHPGMRTGP